MTKIEKEWVNELIDACCDMFIQGVGFACALRPYYATLKLALKTGWEGVGYLIWTEKQKTERAHAMRFRMHNLDATRPEGLCGEVKEGAINA